MGLFSKNNHDQSGIKDIISSWVTNILDTWQLRLQLASLEAKELLNYWKIVALLVGIAAGAACTTFLLVNTLILVIFHEHIVVATAIMLGVYALITFVLVAVIVTMSKNAPQPFGDTIEEIRKDAHLLSGKVDDE